MLDEKGKYTFEKGEGWIGIGLDGTLAYLDSKTFPVIGKPIPLMMIRINRLLKEGKRIKIFTSRVGEKELIKSWLKKNKLPENLEITNVKDYDCILIYDTKVKETIFNTGYVLE